ncbi:MAG: ribosome small subunit-dependent GTPase A [Leptospiraceae bacterium]|nr:ribosome small subunit-dependent GTPase A [Leptospiraceae bacterium]
MNLLESLGWDSFFESNFHPYKSQDFEPARIIAEYRDLYKVITMDSLELIAEVSGKFEYTAAERGDFPVTGDWVVIRKLQNNNKAIIYHVLERKSKFSRKIPTAKTEEQIVSANIDIAFIVQGLDHNYNLRRLERYLVMAWESGAKPVILLNKADLCEDIEDVLLEVSSVALDTPVYIIDSFSQAGYECFSKYLEAGKTFVFLGSSGVGKSTIINNLMGKNVQKTNSVRENDSRGRHTTTNKQLFLLGERGILIDTPGMRELQLWNSETGLKETFLDVEELLKSCRFKNCSHEAEPGCAVQEALENGSLDPIRYEHYQKLQKEIKYLESRQDESLALQRKWDEKKFHKKIRKVIQHKRI